MKFALSSVSTPSLLPEQLIKQLEPTCCEGIEWRVLKGNQTNSTVPFHFRTNNLCTVDQSFKALNTAVRQTREAGLEVVSLSPYLQVGEKVFAREFIHWAGDLSVIDHATHSLYAAMVQPELSRYGRCAVRDCLNATRCWPLVG